MCEVVQLQTELNSTTFSVDPHTKLNVIVSSGFRDETDAQTDTTCALYVHDITSREQRMRCFL